MIAQAETEIARLAALEKPTAASVREGIIALVFFFKNFEIAL